MDRCTQPPAPVTELIDAWPDAPRTQLLACRALFLDVAKEAEVGRLDETLKWGQPSWRPARRNTGSTLRAYWFAKDPAFLSLYVDCKSNLATRMRDLYPDLPRNDGRRHLAIDLGAPLPEQALRHLAAMTFTYHRTKA